MTLGIGNRASFGARLTAEEMGQKFNPPNRQPLNEMSAVPAAPMMAARPFADEQQAQPKKEKSNFLKYSLITVGVVGAAALAARYGLLSNKVKDFYMNNVENKVVSGAKSVGNWIKNTWNKFFNKEKVEKPNADAPAPAAATPEASKTEVPKSDTASDSTKTTTTADSTKAEPPKTEPGTKTDYEI